MGAAKLGAMVMTTLTLMYVILLGQRGWLLLQQEQPVAQLMGALILAFPAVALYGIFLELRFGLRIERMAKQVEQEGRWPLRDLPLRPSGRPEPTAAQAAFETIRGQSQAAPDDWHSWFNLGLAYDACGDRRRARQAMRKALQMQKTANQAG